MLTLLFFNTIAGILTLTMGTVFSFITGIPIGAVTSLPFGLDAGFLTFSSVINGALASMPWIEVPFRLILIAIQIKVFLVVFDITRWLINLLRG